jgi:hypothetical protein
MINDVEKYKGEIFVFHGLTFDIQKAVNIINSEKTTSSNINISDVVSYFSLHKINKIYALNSKNINPIIVATLNNGFIVIDGYHRAYRDNENLKSTINSIILNEEQTKRILINRQ